MSYQELYEDLINRDLSAPENLHLIAAEENADQSAGVSAYTEEWYRIVLAGLQSIVEQS